MPTLSDPKLQRTELELAEAMDNASAAEDAVFELFQDLDGFSLDDYTPLSDTTSGMQRIVDFVKSRAQIEGDKFMRKAMVNLLWKPTRS